ncbi:MAG: hypothetical protein VX899_05865 [Myxococcota bacterium]|nr:hypothetical protein [Myxococcota bacterium]
MLLISLLACADHDATLQPLVNARAEQIARDAELACRLGLAGGGMVAELAPQQVSWWAGHVGAGVDLHPDTASVLGLSEPGVVSQDMETGAILLRWEDVEFSPDIWGRVELDVLRPQTSWVLRFEQEPDSPPRLEAEARFRTLDVDGDPQVQGELMFETAERSQTLTLPEGEAGMRWPAGGGYWPAEGQFTWAESWQSTTRSLEALEEGGEASGQSWAVVVTAEDWSDRQILELSRHARSGE